MTGFLDGVVGKWDWSVNDVIVLSTVIVFVFIVTACSIMWTARPASALKKVVESENRLRQNWQSTLDHANGGGGTANSSAKSKGSGSKSKKKSKKKGRSNRDLEAGSRDSSASLEVDSLLGGHLPGTSTFFCHDHLLSIVL